MNHNQFKTFWNQLKAPLKAQWEKLTDDDLRHIDGDMAKFQGILDQRYGEQKKDVNTWANRRYAHWSGWYQDYEYEPVSREETT
jgi:uncharacterized protein YjbJ (UPF0337 family)